MTKVYKQERNKLIQLIHVAKRDLGLDEELYRQILVGATSKGDNQGKASCSDMTIKQLESVLDYLKRNGWKPKQKNNYSPKTRGKAGAGVIDKIRALWIDMYKIGITNDGSEHALNRWVKRTTAPMNKSQGIERVDWLLKAHGNIAQKTLESLKRWQKRVRTNWLNEDLRTISVEQERTGQSQRDIVQQLLEAKAIMYWPLFNDMDIKKSKRYCTNRRKLNR